MRTLFKIVLWLAVVLGAVLGGLYALLFDVWRLPADDPMLSASIAPTVAPGDVLVISRGGGSIQHGNLVRCDDPQAPGRFVVARAMGHSGEAVAINGEMVSVDGHRNPSPHACDEIQRTLTDPTTGQDVQLVCSVEELGNVEFEALHSDSQPLPAMKATVEPGRWFLVSDDRHLHVDSRDYGAVDARSCQHIVFRIVGASGLLDPKSRFSIIW
jgi:signal peptidase I